MASVCEEVLERASLAGNDDVEVAAHLQGCAACRESVRGLRLLETTRPEPSHQVLVGFAARTRAKLAKQESGGRLLAPLRTMVMAGAVAAAGATGVFVAVDGNSLAPNVSTAQAPANAGTTSRATPSAAAAEDELDELFRLEELADALEPYEGLYYAEGITAEELYALGLDDELAELFESEEG